jgi:hypothetical protein
MGHFWTAHMDDLRKKNWQRCKLYTFPISFKKEIVFNSCNEGMSCNEAFSHRYFDINFNIFAERNYFLVFIWVFCFESFKRFFVGFLTVFCGFYKSLMRFFCCF